LQCKPTFYSILLVVLIFFYVLLLIVYSLIKGIVTQDFWVFFSLNCSSCVPSEEHLDDFDFWWIFVVIFKYEIVSTVLESLWSWLKRSIFWKIVSLYSPCHMLKVWSSGQFFEELFLFRAMVAFIYLTIDSRVYLTPRNSYSERWDKPQSRYSNVNLTPPRLFWFLLCNSAVSDTPWSHYSTVYHTPPSCHFAVDHTPPSCHWAM